ncbi:hypothetical protein MBUL_00337 [Methylobacterium bullatum]|uniref:Glycosyltransferase 61 catalytic domain-containing protein n=1 Tax=Methylobacterium bullatum TaxID=570505 RepID=A0A679IW81_9HYPH|nr:hypothetical protein MBUL_00337 [Methylobacterium bullatum]
MTKLPDLQEILPAHGRQAIRLCREDIQYERWEQALARTSDLDACFVTPPLLQLRLQAAVRVRRTDVIDAIVQRTIGSELTNKVKFALIRILFVGGCGDQATHIFSSDRTLRADPDFLRLARLYSNAAKDKDLKRQMRIVVRSVSRGGSDIAPSPSGFRFDSEAIDSIRGNLTIALSPSTPPHHAKGLRFEIAKLKRELPKQPASEVLEYRDVFTDPSGQIWNAKKQVIQPRGQPIEVIRRSEVQNIAMAFAANRMSRGIYHWLIDYLPGFAWIESSGVLADEQFAILLNGQRKFEHETLDLLGLGHRGMPINKPVFVERLLVARPEAPIRAGQLHLQALFGLLGERSDALARQNGVALPERVYVTRRDAARRTLTNQDEIEVEAAKHGFVVLEFSELPLWHKIAIARNARFIMGPHGGGLSHNVFARPGTKIIELVPIRDDTYYLRSSFAWLSFIKGLEHVVWLENQRSNSDTWTIQIKEFRTFLAKVLRSPPSQR